MVRKDAVSKVQEPECCSEHCVHKAGEYCFCCPNGSENEDGHAHHPHSNVDEKNKGKFCEISVVVVSA